MKKEILGGLLATTTLLDSGATFIGAKNNAKQEDNFVISLVLNNFWLILVVSILLTAIYIILIDMIDKKHTTFKTHHYVALMSITHAFGAITWFV